jgi:hypothetical protein
MAARSAGTNVTNHAIASFMRFPRLEFFFFAMSVLLAAAAAAISTVARGLTDVANQLR